MKRNFQSALIAVFAVGFFLGAQTMAQAKTKQNARSKSLSQENARLQEQINELKENQKALERKYEVDKEETAQKEKEKAKDSAIVTANSDGFAIKSADGAFQLKIKGYIQTDGRFFLKDGADTLNNQFVLRRVRPIFEGTVFKYFDFRIMPDFGEGKVVLQDAYTNIHPKTYVQFQGGKFKEPVGLERLQSATNLLFIERALPTNLVPNRDVGLQLHGEVWDGVFHYALGIFDGVLDRGSTDGDTSDGKDFAGRVFVHPFKKINVAPLQGFGVGISGTYGSQGGNAATPNLPTYKSDGQNTIFSYLTDGTATAAPTAAGTTIANGKRFRISPQGYFYYGPFGLLGEYVISTTSVAKGPAVQELTDKAWQVAVSYVLTGEKASYGAVIPKNPINPKKGHWGAWQLVGRYAELEIDPASFPTFADPTKSVRKAQAWGVGVNWYLNKNFKASLDFNQTFFKGGAKAADGGNRPTENALFARLQISY